MHTNEQFRWMGVCLKWPGLGGTDDGGGKGNINSLFINLVILEM